MPSAITEYLRFIACNDPFELGYERARLVSPVLVVAMVVAGVSPNHALSGVHAAPDFELVHDAMSGWSFAVGLGAPIRGRGEKKVAFLLP